MGWMKALVRYHLNVTIGENEIGHREISEAQYIQKRKQMHVEHRPRRPILELS